MLRKRINRRENSNIEIQISKQMRYGTFVFRFCHWNFCHLNLFRASIFEFRISMLLQNGWNTVLFQIAIFHCTIYETGHQQLFRPAAAPNFLNPAEQIMSNGPLTTYNIQHTHTSFKHLFNCLNTCLSNLNSFWYPSKSNDFYIILLQ